ncbi:hypothetical protein J3R82DRAFT_8527 [Butyriboletus roseoflavus]|nr:hypothetical protein J3R82DRAFT_8527 [Butyriboletus roseoflavus]
MRLAHLEQEEVHVQKATEEKDRQEREEGKIKMDFGKTPLASELQDIAMELAAASQV